MTVETQAATLPEVCPDCGSSVIVTFGPDIRFNPPCVNPRMWRAECSECVNDAQSWTSFTRQDALDMWNHGIRTIREQRNQ
jgi:hypothetical protein